MKQISLKEVASEFDMIDDEYPLFFSTERYEFERYDPENEDDEDEEEYNEDDEDYVDFKYDRDEWISSPTKYDINEYRMMEDFIETISDKRKNELLSVAITGRGAFRRFKDTLHVVDLQDEWYSFKDDALIEIARRWCEDNNISYIDDAPKKKDKISEATVACPDNIYILPYSDRLLDEAAGILRDALSYTKDDALFSIKQCYRKRNLFIVAMTKDTSEIIGIACAIPQYGFTGWELHPLAVKKAYQRQGVGSLLLKTIEDGVVAQGGVMIYLGSDDETGTTSLYNKNLYEDTFDKLKNIENINGHPFPFYLKMGYKVVGVLPDANGIGKPDIYMAKRLKK